MTTIPQAGRVLALLALLAPTLTLAQAVPSRPGLDAANDNVAATRGYVDAVTRVAPATGGAARTLAARAADEVNVKDMADGVCTGDAAIDTGAMKAALAKAAERPGLTVRLPACTYRFQVSPGSIGFKVPSDTTVRGDGEGSLVTWTDEGTDTILFSSTGTSQARAQNITFENFRVRGRVDTLGHVNAYPFLPYHVDGLTFRGIVSEQSRTMGIVARFSTSVTAADCKVRFAGRDGINFATSTEVSVRDNDISHTDDDAIAVHSSDADPWKVRRNVTITGNRIFGAGGGIHVLSARHAIISGNSIDSTRLHGIDVSTVAPASGPEGVAAGFAITITGNSITNIIDRTNIDGLNGGAVSIRLSGDSARPGTLAAVPGEPNAATGRIADPYREIFANASLPTTPTPGSFGIIVANNLVARTLPASDGTDARFRKWSDLGAGPMFTRKGPIDPSLAEADMRGYGVIVAGGVLRDVSITGNIFRGLDTALLLSPGLRYDNIVFRGNQLVDLYSHGVMVNMKGPSRLFIDANLFDLDPYLKHPNRGAGGTWAEQGAPLAVSSTPGSNGVFVRGNTVRNASAFAAAGLSAAGWYFAENLIEADASVFDRFSPANRGVGLVPASTPKARYVQVGSDPGSTTFGAILAMPPYP